MSRSTKSKADAQRRGRVFSRLYVQAIFALAAALAISTSACGKKEDGATPVPASTPVAGTPVVPVSTSEVGKVAGVNPAKELDQQSSAEASQKVGTTKVEKGEEVLKTLRDDGSSEGDEPSGEKISGAAPNLSTATEVEPERPEPELPVESVFYMDPNGLTPDQLFAAKSDVDQAGPFIGEIVRSDIVSGNGLPLFYTGASHDNLRTRLYTMVNQEAALLDDATREANKQLAQTVQLASFSIDWKTRTAIVNFKLERVGSRGEVVPTLVTMTGELDSLGRFELKARRRQKLSALLACMDISGGCNTVHIRVQDRASGRLQTAHMIARHTSATLYIDGNPAGLAKNAEYDRLMGILQNTVKYPQDQNVVEQLALTTSETIGGASNFAVTMRMRLQNAWGARGGDTIEVTGPLVKPRKSNSLDVALNASPALTTVDGKIVTTDAIGTQGRIADTIRSARLLKNDGQGNLQLELTVRKATIEAAEDRIILTVGRIHTPTVSPRIPIQ